MRASRYALMMVGMLSATACQPKLEPWQVGERYRYQVELRSEARSEPDSSAPMFDFVLKGTLAITPLDRERFALAFESATFGSQQLEAGRARFERVARELREPQTVTLAAGKLVEQRLPKDAEALTVAIMRNLGAALQLPGPRDDAKVEREGFDATGRYLGESRAGATHGDERHFVQRKLRYLGLIARQLEATPRADVEPPLPVLRTSRGELVLRGDVLTSDHYREDCELELLAGRKLAVHTELDMRLLGHAKASAPDAHELAERTVALAANQPYVHASGEFDLDAAKIGDRTFASVIAELEALSGQHDDAPLVGTRNGIAGDPAEVARGKQWTTHSLREFQALSALLRRNADDVQRAAKLVRSGSAATPAILSSLAAAGTDAAQQALIELMEAPALDGFIRRSAAFSLVRSKHPTSASAEALRARLDDPTWHEYAELGLGTFVRLFAEAGRSADATRFGDALVAHLQAAKGDAARVAALTALSNSGYLGALASVQSALQDESAEVRAAAVKALRLMHAPEVDALILAVLEHDDSREVRLAAFSALHNREPTPRLSAAVVQQLEHERDATVRQQALNVLVRWSRTQPSLLRVLEQVAARDDNTSVRTTAANAVSNAKALAALTPAERKTR